MTLIQSIRGEKRRGRSVGALVLAGMLLGGGAAVAQHTAASADYVAWSPVYSSRTTCLAEQRLYAQEPNITINWSCYQGKGGWIFYYTIHT